MLHPQTIFSERKDTLMLTKFGLIDRLYQG